MRWIITSLLLFPFVLCNAFFADVVLPNSKIDDQLAITDISFCRIMRDAIALDFLCIEINGDINTSFSFEVNRKSDVAEFEFEFSEYLFRDLTDSTKMYIPFTTTELATKLGSGDYVVSIRTRKTTVGHFGLRIGKCNTSDNILICIPLD